jgi:hypothetical protein
MATTSIHEAPMIGNLLYLHLTGASEASVRIPVSRTRRETRTRASTRLFDANLNSLAPRLPNVYTCSKYALLHVKKMPASSPILDDG